MGGFSTVMTMLLGIKFIVKPVMTTKETMMAVDKKTRVIQSILCGTVIGLIVEDEKGKPVAAGVRNVDGIQAKAHQIYSMTEEREWVELQK